MKKSFIKEKSKYLVAIVRADIPPSTQGVQIAHAVARSISAFGGLDDETRFVFLSVPDKKTLIDTVKTVENHPIDFVVMDEPDHDQGLTAMATKIICNEKRKLFKNLSLWKI